MKLKAKLAQEFVKEFAQQLPGSFDFGEGMKCYLAGFEKAREMAAAGFKLQGSEAALAMYEHLMSMGEEEV